MRDKKTVKKSFVLLERIREKLEKLGISENEICKAVRWARKNKSSGMGTKIEDL